MSTPAASLRDLGYVGARRIHVLPEWAISPFEGPAAVVARVCDERPGVDGVVIAASGAPTLDAHRPGSAAVTVARRHGSAFVVPQGVHAVTVEPEQVEEARQVLRRLGFGDCSQAAAVAMAGLWLAPASAGTDVVVVLGDFGDQRVRRAA